MKRLRRFGGGAPLEGRGVVKGRFLDRAGLVAAAVAMGLGCLAGAGQAIGASDALQDPFPRPRAIEPNVAFWRDVFARYSRNHTIIHDNVDLDRVYAVLDFRDWAGPNGRLDAKQERLRRQREKEARARYVAILERLETGRARPGDWTIEEQRVAALFKDAPGPDRYQGAAERVRLQSGLRERFREGYARLKGFEPAMVEIFRRKGVPPELARMTLVESTFDLEAYSKVGAAGVWQFMPRTGRQYLRIDSAIDERRDPLRSTWAAAEHLRSDYESLGSWPLAITAYNHGRGGIARGVRMVGSSDIGALVRRYEGRNFGFASRNFYAEFLAALDVTRDEERFFGGPVEPIPAPRSREIRMKKSMRLHYAARQAGVGYETLIAMNPAFLSRVVDGRSSIPAGYRMRVPATSGDAQLALAQADASRAARGRPRYQFHHVRRGQTLGGIARRYGTTAGTLQRINGIRRPRSLRVGAVLKVPAG